MPVDVGVVRGRLVNRVDVRLHDAGIARARERETAPEAGLAQRVLRIGRRELLGAHALESGLHRNRPSLDPGDAEAPGLHLARLAHERRLCQHAHAEPLGTEPLVGLEQVAQICGNDLGVAARVKIFILGERRLGRAHLGVIPVTGGLGKPCGLAHLREPAHLEVEGVPETELHGAVAHDIDGIGARSTLCGHLHVPALVEVVHEGLEVEHEVVGADDRDATLALTPCYIFVYSVLHLGLVAIENDMPRTRLIGPQVAPAQVVHDKQHGIGAPRVPGSVGAYVARLGVVARRYPKLRPLRFESHPRTFFTIRT